MYYWEQKENLSLETRILELQNINRLYIATAYFSEKGLEILKKVINKNHLSKAKVYVYLSSEFTKKQPHKLLRQLCEIANVKIFFNRSFHAKVYYFKGKVSWGMFGSSNLTDGGFLRNIEFDCLKEADEDMENALKSFFEFCEKNADNVDENVIQYYEENQKLLKELLEKENQIRRQLVGYLRKNDAIQEEQVNLEDFYFTFRDYETFFERNEKRTDNEIKRQRREVQEKLLKIHEKIYPEIEKLGVYCHWSSKHITSLIEPSPFNHYKVGWLGVRYGKAKAEIDIVNSGLLSYQDKEEIQGFQKHGCLQFCIVPDGFEMNLFLAVKNGAIDRDVYQKWKEKDKEKVQKEMQKLSGDGLIWEIYNEVEKRWESFAFENDDVEAFCRFLQKYNREGCESYLKYKFEADDIRIQNFEDICILVVDTFKRWINLYNLMVWRPGDQEGYRKKKYELHQSGKNRKTEEVSS